MWPPDTLLDLRWTLHPLADPAALYKTMTTNAYIRGVREQGWPSFAKRVWQRGYYEHVVRDDDDLNRIRQYIIDNPTRWSEDEEHPDARP